PTARSALLGCGHTYCVACMMSMYESARLDVSYFPLSCCSAQIEPSTIESMLGSDTVEEYRNLTLLIEANRKSVPGVLDEGIKDISESRGWKICPQCSAVVEKVEGCVHITCRCKYKFCYTCVRRWKTCHCELYPAAEINMILGEPEQGGGPGDRGPGVEHVHHWVCLQRPARCDGCRMYLPYYHPHCAGCAGTLCTHCWAAR
ncbi:hypothetical protein BDK51DRAFT_21606, partial [Blyttiomyces helicus]